jgi:predicted aspartyl protease
MIRGYFSTVGTTRLPFLYCELEFPSNPEACKAAVELLVDTGADRTILSPVDAESIGIDTSNLEVGRRSSGIGGVTPTRVIESRIIVQNFATPLRLHIPEARLPIPSLLGRDFMLNFALFMEERTGRVMFLDQEDLNDYQL